MRRAQIRAAVPRRLIPVLVVAAVVAAGWYIGSRAGRDSAGTPDDEALRAEGAVYRNVGGRVVRVDPEAGVITIDHDAIDGLMAAMMMDFTVADLAELPGLSPGDRIRFDIVRIGDTYQAVWFRRDTDGGEPDEDAIFGPPDNPLGPGSRLPALDLIAAEGTRFRLDEMAPRHKLITFFYARCPLQHFCPAQAQRLSALQEHLEQRGSGLHLVSLTLDGEHDGSDVVAGYARRYRADPARWTIAGSDDPAAVRAFARRAGAGVRADADGYEIDHALVALRVDGDRIVDRVYGLDAIEKLAKGR